MVFLLHLAIIDSALIPAPAPNIFVRGVLLVVCVSFGGGVVFLLHLALIDSAPIPAPAPNIFVRGVLLVVCASFGRGLSARHSLKATLCMPLFARQSLHVTLCTSLFGTSLSARHSLHTHTHTLHDSYWLLWTQMIHDWYWLRRGRVQSPSDF